MQRNLRAITIILITVFPLSAEAFRDVPNTHPQAESIQFAERHGIVRGYENDTFRPQQRVNRAEFVTMIMRSLFSIDEIDTCLDQGFGLGFSDVGAGTWFAPSVCIARRTGSITGYSDGTFHPSQPINAAEAAAILVKAYGIPSLPSEPWYDEYITALTERGALPATMHTPSDFITRGQLAEMLYHLSSEPTPENASSSPGA